MLSNDTQPTEAVLKLAAEHGTCVVTSPLDSYVTSRMVTLSEPCRALAETDPLTVGKDELVRDIAEQIKDVHYRAVVAVDGDGKPVGVVTRSDSSTPSRAASCSSTTASARRPFPASRRPRSSRSSTTTTSARSRPSSP